MPGRLSFGTDGVRGRALTELTPEYVRALGAAAGEVLGAGRWLIGRDTRESGPVLEAALIAGLRAAGATPESVGVVPTPALAHLSAVLDVPAAMITASHNPFDDNGVKVFAPGGVKLTDAVERQIEAALVVDGPDHGDDTADAGVATVATVGLSEYAGHLLAMFPERALDGLHVVLDCANGAMSAIAPQVTAALGATVTVIHADPDGRNINDQCGATNPASLSAAVRAHGADVGLAFDGDGDRIIAVDEHGTIVDGDRLIAMAALQLRERGELFADTVVVTVMSNLGFHRAMEAVGIHVVSTAVGDRYVLEALDAGGFAIGGEQSGHIIYRHLATTGDGLLAGLRLARFVAEHHRPLSDLAAAVMTTYPQVLVNVPVTLRQPDVAELLAPEIAVAETTLAGEGRVLLRPSGTEPLVRVMVEAATTDLARSVAEGLADAVRLRFA
ncbi:MAG: phosphoglucosamine mutase [Ilumatobacteraceae bacterium]